MVIILVVNSCTCLSVFLQAVLLLETLQRQSWQPRWQEGRLAPAKSLTSQLDICGDHLDTSLQCLLAFPWESLEGLQSSSTCLPPCGTERSSDLSTLARWVLSQPFHLMINIDAFISSLTCKSLRSCTQKARSIRLTRS